MRVFTLCEVKAFNVGSGEEVAFGYGGFGACVMGRDPRTGEDVVIKSFKYIDRMKMLMREATALHALRHVPGMQQMRGVCVRPVQLISLFAGPIICSYFEEKAPSVTTALSVFLQVARTVQGISGAGYAHTDIKVDNVCALQHKGRDTPQVTVIDVGLASRVKPTRYPWHDDHERANPQVQHGIGRCGEPKDVRGVARLMGQLLPCLENRDSLSPVHAWVKYASNSCLAVLVRVLQRALKEEGKDGDGDGGEGLEFH